MLISIKQKSNKYSDMFWKCPTKFKFDENDISRSEKYFVCMIEERSSKKGLEKNTIQHCWSLTQPTGNRIICRDIGFLRIVRGNATIFHIFLVIHDWSGENGSGEFEIAHLESNQYEYSEWTQGKPLLNSKHRHLFVHTIIFQSRICTHKNESNVFAKSLFTIHFCMSDS